MKIHSQLWNRAQVPLGDLVFTSFEWGHSCTTGPWNFYNTHWKSDHRHDSQAAKVKFIHTCLETKKKFLTSFSCHDKSQQIIHEPKNSQLISFRLSFPVTGKIPLQLTCSYPGKWFTIKRVTRKTDQGIWQQVPKAKGVFEKDCKKSRTVQKGANGLESAICTISGCIPGIDLSQGVKIEYYCWEFGKI